LLKADLDLKLKLCMILSHEDEMPLLLILAITKTPFPLVSTFLAMELEVSSLSLRDGAWVDGDLRVEIESKL
jgi:hypothetical protein